MLAQGVVARISEHRFRREPYRFAGHGGVLGSQARRYGADEDGSPRGSEKRRPG